MQVLATDMSQAVSYAVVLVVALFLVYRLLKNAPPSRMMADPEQDLFAVVEEDPLLKPDQLASTVVRLKQYAQDQQLLEAGKLLRQVRRSIDVVSFLISMLGRR